MVRKRANPNGGTLLKKSKFYCGRYLWLYISSSYLLILWGKQPHMLMENISWDYCAWNKSMIFLFERAGWVECWTVPSVVFTIDYSWHPIYPQKADEQLKQSCKCHYLFLVSVLYFRNYGDFIELNCLNLQKWILNWTTMPMGECWSLEYSWFDLKTDSTWYWKIPGSVPVHFVKGRYCL